ncbi:hypothetical protein FGIG_08903 [Fasciola gigantica]|uniref:Uncharacterized protein n=1 Tax=Fasciola gigantica TaxID=46835 RepID=A0A504YMP1_FASGI|nr:hypothetical protein FGIG_08903 [Fasciola gigantica]
MNVPSAHWVLVSRTGVRNGPHATLTPFSRTVLGLLGCSGSHDVNCQHTAYSGENELQSKLEAMFSVEFTEASSSEIGHSEEDKQALHIGKLSILKIDNHYQLSLHRKKGRPSLPSNYSVALRRLQSVEKRLQRDAPLRTMYADIC